MHRGEHLRTCSNIVASLVCQCLFSHLLCSRHQLRIRQVLGTFDFYPNQGQCPPLFFYEYLDSDLCTVCDTPSCKKRRHSAQSTWKDLLGFLICPRIPYKCIAFPEASIAFPSCLLPSVYSERLNTFSLLYYIPLGKPK